MKNNGFTLIEVLAVLIIIMILITITIPILSDKMKETKTKAMEAQVNNIEIAAKKYATDNIRDLDELNRFGFMNLSLKTLIDNNYIGANITIIYLQFRRRIFGRLWQYCSNLFNSICI